MDKFLKYTLSVVLMTSLYALPSYTSQADAASKSKYSKSKKASSKKYRKAKRGGGGCQNLSRSSLESRAKPYRKSIRNAARKYGVQESLIKSVITIESCFKSKARGAAGEKGLMQLMPGTARRFNIKNGYSVSQNINGGARYLSYLLKRYNGNAKLAVAAYNAGEGNVSKSGRYRNKQYVRKITKAYSKFTGKSLGKVAYSSKKTYSPKKAKSAAKKIPKVTKASYSNKHKAHVTNTAYHKPTVQRAHARTYQAPRIQKAAYNKPVTLAPARVGSNALPWPDLQPARVKPAKTSKAASTGKRSYTVRSGDTVYEVMRQTGVPVNRIIALNGLGKNPNNIKAGQRLRLR